MWNLKAKIESDDLNKQLQVNEKEAVDEKKKTLRVSTNQAKFNGGI